jgi:hypothetical protein
VLSLLHHPYGGMVVSLPSRIDLDRTGWAHRESLGEGEVGRRHGLVIDDAEVILESTTGTGVVLEKRKKPLIVPSS